MELIGISNTLASIYSYQLTGLINKQLVANDRDGYVSVDVAQFDINKGPQILTQSYFAQRNLLYMPGSENQETVVWEDFPEGARRVMAADLTANGTDDLVVSSFRSNELMLYEDNCGLLCVYVQYCRLSIGRVVQRCKLHKLHPTAVTSSLVLLLAVL